MIDFIKIQTRLKNGRTEVYPKFVMGKSKDLMIRGGDFYAVWIEELGRWSTDENDLIKLIDKELDIFAKDFTSRTGTEVLVMYMWDADSGSVDKWHKYCQKQCRDSYHMLDEKIIFVNDGINKEDYASKRLNYPLEPGECPAWDKIIGTLYSERERAKIEWAIGSIVTGDSKYVQKFMVLYGAAGTGKSTILNIVQDLFDGYYSVFDAKALGSANAQFALEPFKNNPLVAIQHDGDLSRIEDNTRLNSLVSHEQMTVNEKHKSTYTNDFKCFIFMGSNKHVKITDAKSGLLRRLIDVSPSGKKIPAQEYKQLIKQVKFELGAIACHCRDVYLSDPGRYDDYTPIGMMGVSNDFYNFVIDSYSVFLKADGTTLKSSWEMYKNYCEDAKVQYPFSKKTFREELKNYFREYSEDLMGGSSYKGFKTDIFQTKKKPEGKIEENKLKSWLEFNDSKDLRFSVFDQACAECPAQYATDGGTPTKAWNKVISTLADIDTSKLHYVKVLENHIVIDFDIPDENGKKSYERNFEEASKWPRTYAELSKSGGGIHLHYIYSGDPKTLSRIYEDHIEIKVFTGKSSLRRKLTKCNDIPIASISSGLPTKGEDKLLQKDIAQTEKGLRTTIKRCLNKEVHAGTKPNVDFIFKILEDAYEGGLKYDVSDMQNAIFAFAAQSTNQAEYCINLVNQMRFKSEEPSINKDEDDTPIVFYDIEVFPNLFLVNWKVRGEGKPIVRMINPTSADIEEFMQYRLVGFNCRRYDNHILYARLMGYTNEQLYGLSQKIINSQKGDKNNGMFGEAYNISYADVYDFAAKKQSLKKWEIELGIHHQELGLPWDKSVPEERWVEVAEYCDNDVIATEAVFEHLQGDFTARQILADLANMTVNDTTNSLTTRIIFGSNRKPQSEFMYRNLAEPIYELDAEVEEFLKDTCPKMLAQPFNSPVSEVPFNVDSKLPYFPGYKYDRGKSTYRGEDVGEGGDVYAEQGMYGNVALLDVASMHPHSTIAECLFGPRFTKAYYDIVYGRVNIKHEAWDIVNQMLDGKLTPFIQKVIDGEMPSGDLATALKIAINSVYGLTSASFDNPFRDPRNIDNIVAKRGALFMIDLKYAVQEQGYTVAHIKTDSIKIPDATPEIIEFVMEMGAKYGYTFEHEATYERMCLVNDAVYIAKYATPEQCEALYGYVPGDNKKKGGEWTATGAQFAVPYLYKKLFTREPIEFEDMCETFAVSKGDLYLDNNEHLPDVSGYEKELEKAENKYKEGKISDLMFESMCEGLPEKIAEGHDMKFVGRVGQFTPISPGYGGGVLYRVADGKNYAATGTKGYRWLESELVRGMENRDDIVDKSFYEKLVNDAVDVISKYGDFEWFVSDDPYISER